MFVTLGDLNHFKHKLEVFHLQEAASESSYHQLGFDLLAKLKRQAVRLSIAITLDLATQSLGSFYSVGPNEISEWIGSINALNLVDITLKVFLTGCATDCFHVQLHSYPRYIPTLPDQGNLGLRRILYAKSISYRLVSVGGDIRPAWVL